MSMTLSVSALDEALAIVRLKAGSVARTRFGCWIAPIMPHRPRKAAEEKTKARPSWPFFTAAAKRTSDSQTTSREDPGRGAPDRGGEIDQNGDEREGESGREGDGQDPRRFAGPLEQGPLALERGVRGAVHEERAEAEDPERQGQGPEEGEERPGELRPGVERHAADDVAQGDAEKEGGEDAAADEGRLPESPSVSGRAP